MTGGEVLVAGKALIWFAVPLGLAVLELVRTRRLVRCGPGEYGRCRAPAATARVGTQSSPRRELTFGPEARLMRRRRSDGCPAVVLFSHAAILKRIAPMGNMSRMHITTISATLIGSESR